MDVIATVNISNGDFGDWLEFFKSYEILRHKVVENEIITQISSSKAEVFLGKYSYGIPKTHEPLRRYVFCIRSNIVGREFCLHESGKKFQPLLRRQNGSAITLLKQIPECG